MYSRDGGYRAATMQEIAEAAGITKGTIYLYFQTKAELFVATVQAQFQEVVDLLPSIDYVPGQDPMELTTRLGEAFLRVLMAPKVAKVLPLVIAEYSRLPVLKELYFEEILRKADLRAAELIEAGKTLGLVRDLDATIAARCLLGVFFVFALTQEVLGAKELTPMKIQDIAQTILNHLLSRDGEAGGPCMKRTVLVGMLSGMLLLGELGCPGGLVSDLSVAGQIEGTAVDAGSKLGGRVETVHVEEGAWVKKGDVLVTLEASEVKAAEAAARSKCAQAQAQLEKIEAGPRVEEIDQARAALARYEEQYQMALRGARKEEVDAARAQVTAAEAQRDAAKTEYDRVAPLNRQAVAEVVVEKARLQLEGAKAQLRMAQENLRALLEGTREEEIAMAKAARDQAAAALAALEEGARAEDISTARAMRDEALAALELAQANAREATIRAPMDGLVESIDIHPGDLVSPGAVVRITDPEDLDLTVFVSAYALGHIRLGQTVALTTDSHGDERFSGEVTFIASEGEYTPKNLQTQEQRVQQMFAVKLGLDSAGGRLKAGMTATAHFDLRGQTETP